MWSWGQWNQTTKVLDYEPCKNKIPGLNPAVSYTGRLQGGEYSLHYQLWWLRWKAPIKRSISTRRISHSGTYRRTIYIFNSIKLSCHNAKKRLPIINYPKFHGSRQARTYGYILGWKWPRTRRSQNAYTINFVMRAPWAILSISLSFPCQVQVKSEVFSFFINGN